MSDTSAAPTVLPFIPAYRAVDPITELQQGVTSVLTIVKLVQAALTVLGAGDIDRVDR